MTGGDQDQQPSGQCRYCGQPGLLVLDPIVLALQHRALLVHLCDACWTARRHTNTNPD